MKQILTIVAVLALCALQGGCAGLSQAVAAKAQSDKVAVEAANDNLVTGIKDATCALPYGTLLRHPEMQPAAQSICGATSNPADLLPSAKPQAAK
jgi:hypothetical protein